MIYAVTKQTTINTEEITFESDLTHCLEYFKDVESIAVDTETEGFDVHSCKLLTIQLGNAENQWVIDCLTIDIQPLKHLLETKLLLLHNAAFDFKFLWHQKIELKNIYDTFLVECILTAGQDSNDRHLGLNDVALKYTGKEVSKDDRGLIHKQGLTPRVIYYAAHDVELLHEVKDKQMELIRKWNLERVVDLENEVVKVFARMQYEGLLIDKKKWLEVAELTEETVKQSTIELDNIIVNEAKLHPQLLPLLNNQLNLFDFEEKKTRVNWASNEQKLKILKILGYSLDNVAEKSLNKQKRSPIIKELLIFAKNQKLVTSFGKDFLKLINKTTNRLHPEVWQILAGSARISMQNPNCQNIPGHGELGEKIRSCFIAREGCLLVDTDVGGFEARIVTEYSQDPLWLDIFRNGKDVHSEVCKRLFNIPLEDVKKPFPKKKGLSYRYLAKTINFMSLYGGSEFKLAELAQIPIKEAKQLLDNYWKIIPGVKKFLDMIANAAVQKGLIRSDPYYRRIRWFPQLKEENPKTIGEVQRAAKNYVPQSTNGNLIKQILINLQNEIDSNNYNAKILLTVHDEILTEVPADFAEEWKVIQERVMIETIQTLIKSIPVVVSSTIAPFWKKD